ncbi:3-dehydroquinate synthase [Lentzea sp. NEAU-D13]|uniref:3-dehydroquinate synthase n=1 Tax=Lentzea alba TaxID=2714351 RepID=A0A7C9RUG0_9PSEU|nr:3-dehydroquinate synthase [Lentzea alba]NGY63149.1 3-dehydroquinate synthase [Lentzea alba]
MSSYVRISDRIPLPALELDRPFAVSATRTDTYPVHVCRNEGDGVRHLLREIDGRRVAIITDDTVATLHATRLALVLRDHGVHLAMASFPAGEANKSLRTAWDMLDWLASSSIARRDVVLAVGGGVVIDTVGWVASAYMRGVPYVNVPTTLLAHVDAALGGKVAVDHPSAKNLIGAFYQPKAVVSNVGYLSTLDTRQLAAGLAEAIKKGVISSPALFGLIEQVAADVLNRDLVCLEEVVRAASVIKCELVSRDPYEEDLRRPLNFGHTVGHAVETVTGYGPVLHGEAVAFGMTVAAQIAVSRGLLDSGVRDRLVTLLRTVGLPTSLSDLPVPVDPAAVVAALDQVRKIRDGKIRFVLPVELGCTVIADDVTNAEVRDAMLASLAVGTR